MRVGLDLDGVVFDFAGFANRWLSRHHDVAPISVDRWDWYKGYENGDKSWRKLWDHVAETGAFRRLLVLPGAVTSIRRMTKAGIEVVFITARNPKFTEDTRYALSCYGFGDAEEYPLYMEREKWRVAADLYVDDQPANVTSLRERQCAAYLFAQPWNEVEGVGLPTLHGWGDVLRKVGVK